jgi:hypothetical protein
MVARSIVDARIKSGHDKKRGGERKREKKG